MLLDMARARQGLYICAAPAHFVGGPASTSQCVNCQSLCMRKDSSSKMNKASDIGVVSGIRN